jgi:hypothetical protein
LTRSKSKGTSWALESSGCGSKEFLELLGVHDYRTVWSLLSLSSSFDNLF